MKKSLLLLTLCISTLFSDTINFKDGWNFIGLNNTTNLSTDMTFADTTKVKIVWKYINDPKMPSQGWQIYTADDTLKTKAISQGLSYSDTLNYYEGAWVYALKDFNYKVAPKNHNFTNDNIPYHLGWSLVSAADNSDISLNDKIFTNSKTIWNYKENQWRIKNNGIANLSYKPLTTLNPYEAYWIYNDTTTPDTYVTAVVNKGVNISTDALISNQCNSNSGVAVYFALDLDNSGALEESEYQDVVPAIVCDGNDGELVSIEQIEKVDIVFEDAKLTGKIDVPDTSLAKKILPKLLYGYLGNVNRSLKLVPKGASSMDKPNPDMTKIKNFKHEQLTHPYDITVKSDGTFEVDDIPSGADYSLVFVDTASKVGKKIDDISLRPGETKNIDISSALTLGSINLNVQSLLSNSNLSNALVTIAELDREVTTDINGDATIDTIPEGTYSLRISKDGYVSKYITFQVKANQVTNLETLFLNSQKGALTGKVSSNTLDTLENIIIYAKSADGSVFSTLTNSVGKYTFAALPVDSGYSIIASAHGYASSKVDNIDITYGNTSLASDISISKLNSIGNGSIGGFARYFDQDSLNHAGIIVSIEGTDFEAITSRDGSFILNNIPQGNYIVNFTDSNHLTVTKEFEVVAGATTYDRDIKLLPKTGNLVGKIVDENGIDVSGVFVQVLTPSQTFSTISDKNGNFTINGIIAGSHEIVASKYKYGSGSSVVVIKESKTTDLSDDKIVVTNPTVTKIEGYAQFGGAFKSEAIVTIQELNDKFISTGISYTTNTINDNGYFVLDTTLDSKLIEVSVTGNFYNPILDSVTTTPITLKGIYDISNTKMIYVNPLTTLMKDRVKYLSLSGFNYKQVLELSTNEIEDIFGFENFTEDIPSISIFEDNKNSAMLLGASLSLLGNQNNTDLQSFISSLSLDIKMDGLLNQEALKDIIVNNQKDISKQIDTYTYHPDINSYGSSKTVESFGFEKLQNIAKNFKDDFAQDFYKYIDSDGDNILNIDDIFISPITDKYTDIEQLSPLIINTDVYDGSNLDISYSVTSSNSTVANITVDTQGIIKVIANEVGDTNVTFIATNSKNISKDITFNIKINKNHAKNIVDSKYVCDYDYNIGKSYYSKQNDTLYNLYTNDQEMYMMDTYSGNTNNSEYANTISVKYKTLKDFNISTYSDNGYGFFNYTQLSGGTDYQYDGSYDYSTTETTTDQNGNQVILNKKILSIDGSSFYEDINNTSVQYVENQTVNLKCWDHKNQNNGEFCYNKYSDYVMDENGTYTDVVTCNEYYDDIIKEAFDTQCSNSEYYDDIFKYSQKSFVTYDLNTQAKTSKLFEKNSYAMGTDNYNDPYSYYGFSTTIYPIDKNNALIIKNGITKLPSNISTTISGTIKDIVISKDLGYVVSNSSDTLYLTVVNLSNMDKTLYTYNAKGEAKDGFIDIENNKFYVISSKDKKTYINAINLSNYDDITSNELFNYSINHSTYDEINNNIYTVNTENYLDIVTLNTDKSIVYHSHYNLEGYVSDIKLENENLYVVKNNKLDIYDVSNSNFVFKSRYKENMQNSYNFDFVINNDESYLIYLENSYDDYNNYNYSECNGGTKVNFLDIK